MSYEKTEWKKGDVITAEKLNKLEDGVASGGGDFTVVPFSVEQTGENEWTPSITGYEMSDHISTNELMICLYGSEAYYYAGSYDAGVGTKGFEFNNIRVSGDTATIRTFKFTNTGGSSFETKSFSVNTPA